MQVLYLLQEALGHLLVQLVQHSQVQDGSLLEQRRLLVPQWILVQLRQ